jgi:hypothetical protein
MNEMKQNETWPRPKVRVQKIFGTLQSNFSKGHNKSFPKFCSIFIAWMKEKISANFSVEFWSLSNFINFGLAIRK